MAFKKGQSGNPKGRKLGSTTKPRFSDYISEDEVKLLISKAVSMATKGDSTMLKFCLEQHLGKAVQPIGNDGDQAFKISGVEVTVKSANVKNQN